MDGMMQEIQKDQTPITVCICTFRRESLTSTLTSVSNQMLPHETKRRIVVIDNDSARTAEAFVLRFGESEPEIDLEYIHAPGQNISIARNAALKACKSRWLAFIDDDETAAPNWLERLMAKRDGAAAVFGLSKAIYGNSTPEWIKLGDYHSSQPHFQSGIVHTGYTSNVLIDMSFVRKYDLEFDHTLGRTGGEDTDFFYAMHQLGGRLAYAADAVVYDEVVESRRTLRWILKRRKRVGQTYAKMQQRYNTRAYRLIPILSPLKIAFCFTMAAMLAIRPEHAMWWLMRGVFHWGSLSYRISGRVYQEY
jgi:succinoglycan biosynthesis protein ExoM